jgi:hypothetical protein
MSGHEQTTRRRRRNSSSTSKPLPRKYMYPPHQADAATSLVLKQAEVLADKWVSKQGNGL